MEEAAIHMCGFKPADRVLIPGVGNGYDLPYLPPDVVVDGIDISEVMLGIAATKHRLHADGRNIRLSIMDVENLDFPADTFDKAILGLFLTCVYDPQRAFAEVVRVMKPNGEILIYDHLIRTNKWIGTIMSHMDTVMKYNFCSVIRPFDDIIKGHPVVVVKEIKGDPLGFIRGFLLRKTASL
ncbi:phosphatidylethanolamine N-methyltransferase [Candidatus Magnetobacterium bavaricum]|uniref:Phosphatidylethanolamine N-methyltransferase n=1 Tax=Candidatus Magnetobacterium bavaricum TaxID=29290 RepID=A0A0F3GYA4_9BACT|nr:phosphatidylethanolamine N-methyltransferase [Candidatus Magnetobacterium bavaricum]